MRVGPKQIALQFLNDVSVYASLAESDVDALRRTAEKKWPALTSDFRFRAVRRFPLPTEPEKSFWIAISRHNSSGVDMALIPGGTYTMGTPDAESQRDAGEIQRSVTISPFLIAQTEVTQDQWMRLSGGANPARFKVGRNPVELVSWDDASKWCEGAGLALPSEAEWEYAARAGTPGPFAFGDALTAELANFDATRPYNGKAGEFRKKTLPTGSLGTNGFGLHDMHGNVSEWCADGWSEYAAGALRDPLVAAEGVYRVIRGGSWKDPGRSCRSGARSRASYSERAIDVGFRPVFRLR
jgi:formylglycine-generating enzyme required for sulfatase activity